MDDGVRQGELQEEGLEDREVCTRSHAEPLGGQAEGVRLPGGDSVGDLEHRFYRSRLSKIHSLIQTLAAF